MHLGNLFTRAVTVRAAAIAASIRSSQKTSEVSPGADRSEEKLLTASAAMRSFSPVVWVSALRAHQWAKNALVFVPLLTSHQFSRANCFSAALAFAAFSLCASAVYLLNDIVDIEADQAHPTKRFRAVASGDLPAGTAAMAIPFLLLLALTAALAVSAAFAGALTAYFLLTSAYTFRLKQLVIVDIAWRGRSSGIGRRRPPPMPTARSCCSRRAAVAALQNRWPPRWPASRAAGWRSMRSASSSPPSAASGPSWRRPSRRSTCRSRWTHASPCPAPHSASRSSGRSASRGLRASGPSSSPSCAARSRACFAAASTTSRAACADVEWPATTRLSRPSPSTAAPDAFPAIDRLAAAEDSLDGLAAFVREMVRAARSLAARFVPSRPGRHPRSPGRAGGGRRDARAGAADRPRRAAPRGAAPRRAHRRRGRAGPVAVLDLRRARTRRFEVAFILGLEEGSLPGSGSDRRVLDAAAAPSSASTRSIPPSASATSLRSPARGRGGRSTSPARPPPTTAVRSSPRRFWSEVVRVLGDQSPALVRRRGLADVSWPLQAAPSERERLRALTREMRDDPDWATGVAA